MKKTTIVTLLISVMCHVSLTSQITGVFEIRASNAGSGNIDVQMRCVNAANPCPGTSDAILDITFALKWLNSYDANLGLPSGSYGVIRSGPETVQGIYEYQIFQLNVAPLFFPENWNENTWYTIATVNITTIANGPGTFEIAEKGFNPSSNPNFNVNGDDYEPTINGAAVGVSLPIEILEFRGYPLEEKVMLEWLTGSEINSDRFEVERSINGVDFYKIGTVKAAGTSFETLEYSLKDANPFYNKNFYRLKQIDLDGSYEYSKIVSVEIENGWHWSIYPNPNNGQFTLDIINFREQPIFARVYNSQGKVVLKQTLNLNGQTDFKHQMNLLLQPGIYIFEINDGIKVYAQKMFIQ